MDASTKRIVLSRASLPSAVEWLRISHLTVGEAIVDLLLTRHQHDIGVTVLHRHGDVEIAAIK